MVHLRRGAGWGRNKENARNYLLENADAANEIEKKIKEKPVSVLLVTDEFDDALPAPPTSESRAEQAHALCRLLTARSRTQAPADQLAKRGYPTMKRMRCSIAGGSRSINDADFAEQWCNPACSHGKGQPRRLS